MPAASANSSCVNCACIRSCRNSPAKLSTDCSATVPASPKLPAAAARHRRNDSAPNSTQPGPLLPLPTAPAACGCPARPDVMTAQPALSPVTPASRHRGPHNDIPPAMCADPNSAGPYAWSTPPPPASVGTSCDATPCRGDPVSGPGSSRGASVRRTARRAAPRRNPAPERRNAQAGQAPDGHHQRDAPSPGAEPAVSELAARASGRGFQEWIEPATTASAAGLIANAATVTGRNGPPGGPGGDQVARVTRPMTGRFAQVRGRPSPIQRLPSGALPAARTGARRPTRTHVRRSKRPPLLYFPAVIAVRVIRISLSDLGQVFTFGCELGFCGLASASSTG
jgi:hypothetical protein